MEQRKKEKLIKLRTQVETRFINLKLNMVSLKYFVNNRIPQENQFYIPSEGDINDLKKSIKKLPQDEYIKICSAIF